MAWTYHTPRQHHRRKTPNHCCIRQQQQRDQQQCLHHTNFHWINNLVIVFICSLLFQYCPTTTSTQVRIAFSMITHTDTDESYVYN